jgi:hypothetical protein
MHPGRTSRSVTYRSRSSTVNFGVLGDGLPEKKLQLVGVSILINPIKPWVEMLHTPSVPKNVILDILGQIIKEVK